MLILEWKERRKESSMTEKVFKAELSDLPQMTAFLEEQLELLECPMKAQMQIQLSAEELFVNVANYAYVDKKGTVTFCVGPDEKNGGMILRISDYGKPFNPLLQNDPDITLKAEDRNIGGLGILMVKKNMDAVEYEYSGMQNIVTLRKRF